MEYNVDVKDSISLIDACKNNMEDIALKLIETYISNPGAVDKNGNTALIYACKNKMDKVIPELISYIINYNNNWTDDIDKLGINIALTYISENELYKNKSYNCVIEKILQYKDYKDTSYVDDCCNENDIEYTFFMNICKNKMEKMAKLIIHTQCLELGMVNKYGYTALMYACENKMEKVALELINTGKANPDKVNKYGNTALMFACINKMDNIVKILYKIKKHGYEKYYAEINNIELE